MQLNVRLLLGRGIANHPGLVRAIREAGPGECVLAMHHTTKPATAGEDAVDVGGEARDGRAVRRRVPAACGVPLVSTARLDAADAL